MNIEELTVKQCREIAALFGVATGDLKKCPDKRCKGKTNFCTCGKWVGKELAHVVPEAILSGMNVKPEILKRHRKAVVKK